MAGGRTDRAGRSGAFRTRYRVLHQSGRARGCGGHLERRDPLVSPFGGLNTVTDCLRAERVLQELDDHRQAYRMGDRADRRRHGNRVCTRGVVKREVEIVNVDVAVPSAANVTVPGLTEPVGQTRTRPDDEIDGLRLADPDRPLRLVRVIVDEPDEPHRIVREVGEAPMLKSPGGGGGGGGGMVTETSWDWIAARPPESAA